MSTAIRSTRSIFVLGGLLALGLVSFNVWAVSRMQRAQSALTDSLDKLAKNQRSVTAIKRLQNRPRIASLIQEENFVLLERIQQAMGEAGIPLEKKKSDTPGEPVRKGTTSYLERSTVIILKDLSMQQIVQFCQQLEDPDKGLKVRDLAINASMTSKSSPVELWDVTVTLSQLIYSEPTAPL